MVNFFKKSDIFEHFYSKKVVLRKRRNNPLRNHRAMNRLNPFDKVLHKKNQLFSKKMSTLTERKERQKAFREKTLATLREESSDKKTKKKSKKAAAVDKKSAAVDKKVAAVDKKVAAVDKKVTKAVAKKETSKVAAKSAGKKVVKKVKNVSEKESKA